MNFKFISDCLWYSGHVLSGISVVLTKKNYYLAVVFVFFGQFITIISRPIGRLNDTENIVVNTYENDNKV